MGRSLVFGTSAQFTRCHCTDSAFEGERLEEYVRQQQCPHLMALEGPNRMEGVN